MIGGSFLTQITAGIDSPAHTHSPELHRCLFHLEEDGTGSCWNRLCWKNLKSRKTTSTDKKMPVPLLTPEIPLNFFSLRETQGPGSLRTDTASWGTPRWEKCSPEGRAGYTDITLGYQNPQFTSLNSPGSVWCEAVLLLLLCTGWKKWIYLRERLSQWAKGSGGRSKGWGRWVCLDWRRQ